MSETSRVTTVIKLINGNSIRLRHTRKEEPGMLMSRLEKGLEQKRFLILGLKEKTMMIPFSSVESIETSPAMSPLPPWAIQDVTIV
jgi:hypothetical protein